MWFSWALTLESATLVEGAQEIMAGVHRLAGKTAVRLYAFIIRGQCISKRPSNIAEQLAQARCIEG